MLNFVVGAGGVNNAVTGPGPETVFDGVFKFDLTGASANLGDNWAIAAADSQTFGASFSVDGFADQGDDTWSSGNYLFDEADGTLTVIPEPSTLALLGLAGIALAARRRMRA